MGKLTSKGRSRESRHVRLYTFLTGSAAWTDLSGSAIKLLIYLATWENGRNNGEIYMSERMAAKAIGVSKRTAGKLFDELENHGFIAATAKGYFSVKGGPATSWRLTWLSWPAASKPPSNEWREWKPSECESREQVSTATGANFAPPETARRNTAAESSPVDPKTADKAGAKRDPHTVATGGWLHPLIY